MNYDAILNKKSKEIIKYPEIKLDLLMYEQIFESDRLEIFEKYGTQAAITDFAILLGGFVSNNFHTSEGNNLKYRTGVYWTKTPFNTLAARVVDYDGYSYWYDVDRRYVGGRPALPYSSISKIPLNKVKDNFNMLEVEYGEYPQWIVDENYSNELEKIYSEGMLKTTGKGYTTDSRKYDEYAKPFNERSHLEYEYKGSKYIRFIGDSNCSGEKLSDGRKVEEGKAYWVKVEPIIWLVDEEKDIAVCKNIIVSGIQFNKESNYTGDNFDEMNIKRYMDEFLSKEIIPDKINYRKNNKIEKPKFETLFDALKSAKEELNRMSEDIKDISYQKVKK